MPPPKLKPKPKPKEVKEDVKINLLAGYDLSKIGSASYPIIRNDFCDCAFCKPPINHAK